MKNVSIMGFITVLGFLVLISCGGEKSLESRLEKARQLINRGRFEKALDELRPAMVQYSTDGDLLLLSSVAYLGAGKADSAHHLARQFTALYPTRLEGYHQLYRTGAAVEDYDSQIWAVSQLGYLENDRRKYHLEIAELNFLRGEIGMAMRTCNQIFEYDSTNTRAMFIMANSLATLGLYDSAIVIMQRLDETNPDQVEILTNLATFWVNKGDYDQAIVYFQRLANLYPDFIPGWYGLGNAMLSIGDTTGAREAFWQVYSRDSTFLKVDSILRELTPLDL